MSKWPTVRVNTYYEDDGRTCAREIDAEWWWWATEPRDDTCPPDGTYMLVPADALVIVKDDYGKWPAVSDAERAAWADVYLRWARSGVPVHPEKKELIERLAVGAAVAVFLDALAAAQEADDE